MSSARNEDSFLLENYKKIVMKLEDNNLESHITPFEDYIIDSYYKKMPKHRVTKSVDFRSPLPTISEAEKRTTDAFSPNKKKFPSEIPTDTQSTSNLCFKTFVKNDVMARSHRKYISQVSTLVKLSKEGMIEGLNKRHNMTNLIRSIKPGTKWQIMAPDDNQNFVKVFDATSYPESAAQNSTASPSPQKSQIETTDRFPEAFKLRESVELPGLNMERLRQSLQGDKKSDESEVKLTKEELETKRKSILQIDVDEYQKEKEIEERANIIQRMRKTKKSPDPSPNKTDRDSNLMHRRSQSQSSFPQSEDKSEFRFLDKLIINGKVPLDAINYFTGKKKKFIRGVALKEEELQDPEVLRQTMPTIVPKWLAYNQRFEQEHKIRMQNVKIPVFEIVAKEPQLRELSEKYYVANYIMKLDLFAKFNFNIVFRLSEKLVAQKLEEGEVLCKEGDSADTVYIVYAGEVGIFVGELQTLVQKAGPGEYLGRQALDAPGKRAATLKAIKKSHILMLERSYYQSITGGYSGMGRGALNLKDEILSHPFFLMFSELKKLKFMQEANVRKYYKHEVPIKPGEDSDNFLFLIKGKAIRELQVTMNKENKWPEEYDFWKVKKFQKVYVVPLPIEPFELVGFTEMLEKMPRKEKVVITEDSWLLSMTRSTFLTIFDEEDVHRFKMKAYEDEEKKSKKLSELFEIEEMATKQKSEAIMDAMNMNAIEKGRNGQFRQDDKRIGLWKIFKDNHDREQAKRKKLIDIKKTEFIIPRADFLD